MKALLGFLVFLILYTYFFVGVWTSILVASIVIPFFVLYVLNREEILLEELKKRNIKASVLVKTVREDQSKILYSSCMVVAAILILLKLYRLRKAVEPQGNLAPSGEADINDRDSEVNPWIDVKKNRLPISIKSTTISEEQMLNIVSKNMVYTSMTTDDGDTYMANALFIKSNLVLIPDHYFDACQEYQVVCRKKDPDKLGGKFRCRFDKSASVLIPNTDIRVCYVSSGGSFRNLVELFPLETLPNLPFHMVCRNKLGEIVDYYGMTNQCVTSNRSRSFKGGTYSYLSSDTFKGLCGGVLVAQAKGCAIMGIHLGGVTGRPDGVYGQLLQEQLTDAIEEIKNLTTVLVTGDQVGVETKILDKEIMRNEPLHAKSAVNYLPKDSQFVYYGSVIGQVTPRSNIKTLDISESVAKYCNAPNIYMRPKMNPYWWPWQKMLSNASKPARAYPNDLLLRAMNDYMYPLFLKIEKNKDYWTKNIFVLNDEQNLNGIDGVRFIDSIDLSTSIGYPLTGPKRDYVIYEDPNDFSSKRTFVPEIMDEITRVENCYRRGERANIIVKACVKDEVVTKEKCRIFYGAPIALTFLVRKYFLSVVRFLQLHPLLTECSVGINAFSDEWEQLHQHVLSKSDNLFAGDYGKYDQLLPAQLILASIKILIDIAKLAGYDQEHLDIMAAMAGDIVYCYVNYNGDLLGLVEGTHISGNSLTVILNGIGGSLNLRCFFFTVYAEKMHFRVYVAISTYGDDCGGTVDKRCPKFNIKSFAEFLAEYGQKYTMPDKESELVPYLKKKDFEFLKRRSSFIPELGIHLGALDEDSIFKSLHMVVAGGSAPPMNIACADNINGALYEWFAHGKDLYEARRQQMMYVAKEHNITHMIPNLHRSFAHRVELWQEKYLPDKSTTGAALAPDR